MKAFLTVVVTTVFVTGLMTGPVIGPVIGVVRTHGQQLQSITLNYPTRSGASWPLFIAKEGGYYQKYGLDATLVFAGHPAGIAMVVSDQAQMSSYNLESVM
jgi:ABC-type nitrate/sulfonate/bicarbonate transport system substrate-binding protein